MQSALNPQAVGLQPPGHFAIFTKERYVLRAMLVVKVKNWRIGSLSHRRKTNNKMCAFQSEGSS